MSRPTQELVVLMVTVTLCVVVVLVGVGIVVLSIATDNDLSAAAAVFGNTLGVLVGAIAGYLVGRRGGAT